MLWVQLPPLLDARLLILLGSTSHNVWCMTWYKAQVIQIIFRKVNKCKSFVCLSIHPISDPLCTQWCHRSLLDTMSSTNRRRQEKHPELKTVNIPMPLRFPLISTCSNYENMHELINRSEGPVYMQFLIQSLSFMCSVVAQAGRHEAGNNGNTRRFTLILS